MKTIDLTGKNGSGLQALLDDSDFETLNKFRYYLTTKGYVARWSDAGLVFLHTDILGKSPGFVPDHKNRNKLDNQRDNLHFISQSKNQQNKVQVNNTSGFKGVSWNKQKSKWQVIIKHCGQLFNCGAFVDKEEAAKVYDTKAVEFFGPDALTNAKLNLI